MSDRAIRTPRVGASSRAAATGCRPKAPEPGQLILVTGGAGYIGSVLTERLLDRGYRVRILDRLYWGRKPLARVLDRDRARRGRRARHARHRARRRRRRDPPRRALERPDRGVRPRGELADERHRHRDAGAQLRRPRRRAPGVRVLVLALRRAAAGDARRDGADRAARRLRDLEALRRGGAAGARRRGPVPGDPAQRHRLRPQPAHALRPRGQHVRQGRAAQGRALAARRRLDVAAAGRRPGRLGRDDRGRSRRRPSSCAARSSTCCTRTTRSASWRCSWPARSSCSGRSVTLREAPAPRLTRDYECSNTKLASRLGFQPSRSVVEAIDGILASIDVEDKTMLSDPRFYNIRWLELLSELTPQIDQYRAAL